MTGVAQRNAETGFLPVLPPRFALVELVIFASIIAFEFWFNAFPDLTKLNPHPYWIAVLLLSLQYGTVSGLLAAALAIGGTWLIGLPEAEIGESYFAYLIRVWTQPVLWIVVALLLGSFRMRQIEARVYLQQQTDDAVAQAAALSGYAGDLRARVDTLERQIAAAANPDTGMLLNAFADVATAATPGGKLEAAQTAMTRAYPGAASSLYALQSGRLQQVLAVNWPEAAHWQTAFNADEPLVRATLAGQDLSVLRASDELILAGQGLIVVPVLDEHKVVIGLLKLDRAPSVALDGLATQRLAFVARGLAPAVAAQVVGSASMAPVTPAAGSLAGTVVPLRRVRAAARETERGGALTTATTRPPIEPAG